MIIQFDTSKIPSKDESFLAEVILLSAKLNRTIDESLEEMRNILNSKKG